MVSERGIAMKAVHTLLLNRILLTVVACGVAGFASSVWAAPIVDGNVGGGEYSVVLNDTAPEITADFYDSGLDIKALHLDDSSGSYWMGLEVVKAPIDTNGDPTLVHVQDDFRPHLLRQQRDDTILPSRGRYERKHGHRGTCKVERRRLDPGGPGRR